MIVNHGSIESFIDELREHGPACVLEKTVRMEIGKSPADEDGVTELVTIRASAVIVTKSCEYVLQVQMPVGLNKLAADDKQRRQGASDVAEAMREKLSIACGEVGVKLRRGWIEV